MTSHFTLTLSAWLAAAALSAPALAQQTATTSSAQPAAAVPADMADGEVRRIDRDANKVSLRHGEIKSLDMPPMTMVFQIKDAALFDKIKVGDKIKFRAEKAGSAYVVTAIEAAK